MASSTNPLYPGQGGTLYRRLLPRSLQGNPNLERVLSEELYQIILNDPSRLEEKPQEINAEKWKEICEQVLEEIGQLKNPYHNRLHTEQVVECCRILARATGRSPADAQLIEIAGLFHDYGHPGDTYRQRQENWEGNDLSNEEYAALKADNSMRDLLSVRQRLELQGLILSTSFGQRNPKILPSVPGKNLQRDYRPLTNLEKLLAFADIGRFMLGVKAYLKGAFYILEESLGKEKEFYVWLIGEIGFLNHIQGQFDDIKPLFIPGRDLKIQRKLDEVMDYMKSLQNKESEEYDEWERQFQVIGEKLQNKTVL